MSDRDVELRRDHLAGLPDLQVVRDEAGVDGGAARAHRGAHLIDQRLEHGLEILARFEPASAGHDDARLGQLRTVALDRIEADELHLEARRHRVSALTFSTGAAASPGSRRRTRFRVR